MSTESRTEQQEAEIWVVAESCSNVDGILVRSGPDLTSDVLGRLSPGAKVRAELGPGGRVHYQLISGAPESPKTGWVSLKANRKDLLLKEQQEDLKAKESLPSTKNDLDTPASANSVSAEAVHWEVIGTKPEGLLVRTGASLTSEMLSQRLAKGATVRQIQEGGGRLHYELVKGEGPKMGWVSLQARGHELLRRMSQKKQTAEDMLHTDYSGIPRGACTGCRKCQLWQFETMSTVEWGGPDTNTTIEDRRQSYDRKMRGYQDKRKGLSAVCRCGCTAELHLDLSGWLEAVRQAARPFRETYEVAIRKDPAYRHLGRAIGTAKPRRVPRVAKIPAAALQWSHLEVAMHLLSLGVYDPRDDRDVSQGPSPRRPKVSVICPTSQKRHAFHPLLYQNFASQSLDDKELVVVDTGSRPSSFLLSKAAEDSRVVYRHFFVDDSRENDPMSAVILNDGFGMLTGEDVKKRRGLSWKPKGGWSLGFKRNLCCHLARGRIIAHFDDDDLYAAGYLEHMCQALSPRDDASLDRPLACTLAEWHMMDVKDQSFGFFSPGKDPLLDREQRESFQYGYGFSFVYTKAAWELVKFPDTEWSEDGDFMGRLQLKKVPIELVQQGNSLPLAAHTHHPDSTSGGELCGNVRLGYAVPTPEAFQHLLPIVRKVAADAVGLGGQHPLRAEMHRVLDGYGYIPREIRWHEKEQFLKRNPNFGRPVATPQPKAWYQEWQPSSAWRGNGIGFGF